MKPPPVKVPSRAGARVRRSAAAFACAVLAWTVLPAAASASGGGGGGGGGGDSPVSVVAAALDTTTPASGSSGTGQVTLSGAAPSSGAVVGLTSSNPGALSLPASVTVARGSSTGQFQYTTAAVSTPTPVHVTATLGSSSAAEDVTVTPPALASVLTIPTEVEGGQTDAIRPQLNAPAPAGGALVSLTTSSPLVSVPPTVQIPAGSFGAVATASTGVVGAVTTVTITATWNGASVTGQLQLDPVETPTSISLNPATTNGTLGSQGTVTVAAPAPPTGTTVSLQSSDPALASVPSTATVGEFGTTAGFTVSTTPVSTDTGVTISATAGGVTVATTLTLVPTPPPAPALASVGVAPGSVAGGTGSTGTATLNVAAPAGGAVVALFSSNTAAAGVPASVTIPAGATSATFAVTTHALQTTTTVAIGGTFAGSERAGLLGVTGTRGGAVLQGTPSGIFVDPFFLDPVPEGGNAITQITWDGSLESFVLSVSSGQLPPGLTLVSPFRPLTAAIDGIPTTPGTYAFVMKFTGSAGTVFAVPYVWVIGPPAPIVISQANIPAGAVGQAYDGGFFFGGGVAPYVWSISAGALPPGLRINSTTSEITGTPTKAGTFAFTARVTDAKGTFLDTPETIVVS
jgi:hypothetical protein